MASFMNSIITALVALALATFSPLALAQDAAGGVECRGTSAQTECRTVTTWIPVATWVPPAPAPIAAVNNVAPPSEEDAAMHSYAKGKAVRTSGFIVSGAGLAIFVAGAVLEANPCHSSEFLGCLNQKAGGISVMVLGGLGVATGSVLALVGNKNMNDALDSMKMFAVVPTVSPTSAGFSMSGKF